MRKRGAKLEFTAQRDQSLLRSLHHALSQCQRIDYEALAAEVVKMPAARFWVSEERARAIVGQMLRGLHPLQGMRPAKRRMYQELYRRAVRERMLHPDEPLISIMTRIVNSPAPEHYMEPLYARYLIYKSKRDAR